ncbi:hypothetical protein RvY_10813-2 [Ramazzottius varieornatus]|uniref:Laminin subunit alpha-2 n=1 Tax=Ramazzottius varieornatus TaxID=947166 RepID=A0A1D1VGG6_RAMVA|nr:hypothetical protein RvY_10813-2 [Ramazzottius varieornatus]
MEQSGMRILLWTIIAAYVMPPLALLDIASPTDMRKLFFNEDEDQRPLFPVIFNLAAHSRIWTNATCGMERPEVYCRLVEHVLMKPPQCGICDANSADLSQVHVAENAIDGSPRWWQSPTVANGNEYERVTLIIDMRAHYQVAYIIVKVANSPRPAAWELARSLDGVTYKPWQLFARSDSECEELFGMPGTQGRPRYTTDDQVVCSTDYSRIHPLEDGEIQISLINDRPGADGLSQALIDFTTARYVRLRLIKMHTLTADIRAIFPGSSRLEDSSETRRYFYSIKDISIGGQCICFGHARDCPADDEGIARCQCAHNTCGESCERCCPLFNQKPWKAGTANDPAVCEGCQCHGHAAECRYDASVAATHSSLSISGKHEGGGVCVDCQHNTTGTNCERCRDGFFRPLGVDKFNPSGCLPCECQDFGTTGQCIVNEESMIGDLQPGDCVCLEGFAGPKCDHCAPGYRNYPECEPCPCSYAGSRNGEACQGDCQCKDHVEGDRCERCKAGFFNLDANNPQGCTPCFCFGVTDTCQEAGWNMTKIATLDEWILTDSTGSRILYPSYINGTPVIAADDAYELDVFYWLAPKPFRGNKLVSYGGKLDYSITFIKGRGDLTGSYTADVDVILEGNAIRIGKGERFFRESTPHHSSVLLQEQGWHHVSLNGIFGSFVSKEQFMTLLANVEKLMIRGTYHTRQLESRLLMVSLSVADPKSKELVKMPSVEMCECPPGYAGLSCETCTGGHRRVNQTLYNGHCMPCHCHAHATTCDAFTGECRDCLHNTTGSFCEKCTPGYYGDAQSGDPNSCQPCGCPLMTATNNFSPSCVAGRTLSLPDDYICTDCPLGYVGAKCEMCADGYFGNPLVPGNFCQPCVCSGNVDLAAVGNCERLTGKCLKCVGYTEGFSCERCRKGFYGNALQHDCRSCDCSHFGSEHSDCHRNSGQCVCKAGYEGKKCDRCAAGFGQISEGCLPCECDMVGSLSSQCDPVTGQCQCLPGVFGLHCRRCQEGFFGFSDTGCEACACETLGSLNQTCQQDNGQCFCKANVEGRTCDKCQPTFWGITSGRGCESCSCDPLGSISAACDPMNGQCRCRPGVTGRTCSECEVGFFGLTSRGCTKCPVCRIAGQVCDRQTGECICPPLTIGQRCDKCAANSYDYHPLLGCKACNCSAVGSLSSDCDVVTGKCRCKDSYTGKQCDECHFGFFGFPDCKDCGCLVNGTQPDSCKGGQCQCDKSSGQCTCKKNVEGQRCNRCKERSFSLDKENPDGCTTCFCCGKSDRCWQSPYIWKVVTHPGNRVDFTYTPHPGHHHQAIPHLNRTLAMDILPFDVSHVTLPRIHFETPFYWELPWQFLGDKILSYNGRLRFRLDGEYIGSQYQERHGQLASFPLALLQGNYRIILDYKPHSRRYTNNLDEEFEIHFHESKWQNRQNPHFPVTRELLMVAMQNMQHFLIRGNVVALPRWLQIGGLELETAGRGRDTGGRAAIGVEMCDCPAGYNGTSCQSPAAGFYRQHAPDALDHIDHLKLLGQAKPCQCHNHSNECDTESGLCLNCQHSTEGDHCQRCAKGYFGEAHKGQAGSCRRCACPTIEHNYSESCTPFRNVNASDYICDKCQHGFVGEKCEMCDKGYFGHPRQGIPCRACQCNTWGSINQICHVLTGQCQCRGDLQGRDCSKCQVGHVITSSGCVNCMNDYCIRILVDEFTVMDSGLEHFNMSGLSQAPLKRLNRLEERIDRVSLVVQSAIGESASFMDSVFPTLEANFDFDREIRRVMLLANKSATDAISLKERGLSAQKNVNAVCADVPNINERIYQLTEALRSYVMSESSQGSLNVQLILTEAEAILRMIEEGNPKFRNTSAIAEVSAISVTLSEIESLEGGGELVASVRQRYEEIRQRIMEIQRYVENDVSIALRTSRRLTGQTSQKLAKVHETSKILKALDDEVTAAHAQGQLLAQNASKHYQNATKNFEDAQTALKTFQQAVHLLQNTSGILENLNPEYRQTIVEPALEHSALLQEKADMLEELFVSAKAEAADPMKAAQAYERIAQAVDDARNASSAADRTVDETFLVVFPRTEDPLTEYAARVMNDSLTLDQAAKTLVDEEVMGLKEILDEESGRLVGVNATNERTGTEMDSIADRLYLLPIDLMDRILDTDDNITEALRSSDNSVATVDRITESMNVELKPMLDQIKDLDKSSLDQTERLVQESKRDIGNLQRSITDLEVTTRNMEDFHKDTAKRIQKLRNVILSAKQAASTLQVSLSTDADGVCKRSYEPPIIPGSANTMTLTYSTSEPGRSALLMYLGNPRSYALERDFMAVEVVDGRVRFIWNVGQDTKVIQHPEKLLPNEASYIQQNTWYKIEVTRVKNTAQLSVLPMTEALKFDPKLINGSTDAGFTRMDLNRSSEMYVGGLPSNIDDIPEIKAKGFFGCLGQIAIDGQQIGLWNYKSGQGCAGCAAGRAAESGDGGTFRFNGMGFASAPQIKRYNNKRYTIALTFRSFDENALLFLCANDKEPQGDFISLELRDGKVAFQFYLGGQNHLLVITSRRFNTGSFVNVRAERFDYYADLRVEDDHIAASLSPNKPDGLELASREMYFGGVPPGFAFQSKYNITYKPFIGCMKDIQVDVTSVDLLSKTVYHVDVEQGCKRRSIRDVSFSNSNGYLKLPGKTLLANASVSFSFATGQSDGLLIASISDNYKNNKNYWTASLQSGKLVLIFNSGSGNTKIQVENKYYDDRVLHTVSLRKRRKRIELRVDDMEIQEEKAASDGSEEILSDVIYVGGAPSNVDLSAIAASARSFVGCVTGLIINGDLIGFEQLQSFDHAAIGRCEFETPQSSLEGPLLPTALALSRQPRHCTPFPKLVKTPEEWRAVSFGGGDDSRVEVFPARKDTKLFNLTMSVRTFREDGILFYAENPAGEQVLMLSMNEGKMILTVVDESPMEIVSPANYSDGKWLTLRLERKQRRIILQLDEGAEEYIKVSKKFVVSLPFFIAGISASVRPPAGIDRTGFRGCVANVTFNDRPINLLEEKSVRGVEACYGNAESAAFFEGNGHALYNENFRPHGKMLIEMEFRTSAISGELLLLFNPVDRSYVSLKFSDGQMVFNISSPGSSFHVIKSVSTKHRLCDGQWHGVKALFADKVMTLDVDDSKVEARREEHLTDMALPENVPLYIGGRPASVPAQFVPKVPNFIGCIRNVDINGQTTKFHNMMTLYNVHLDSCPTAA